MHIKMFLTPAYEMISGYGAAAALLILICFLIGKLVSKIRSQAAQRIKLNHVLKRSAPSVAAGSGGSPFFLGENEYVQTAYRNKRTEKSNSGSIARRLGDELVIEAATKLIDAYSAKEVIKLADTYNANYAKEAIRQHDTYNVIKSVEEQDFERRRKEAGALIGKLTGLTARNVLRETIPPGIGGVSSDMQAAEINETENKTVAPLKRGRGRPRKNFQA